MLSSGKAQPFLKHVFGHVTSWLKYHDTIFRKFPKANACMCQI